MENKDTAERIADLERRVKSMQTREYGMLAAIILLEFGMMMLSKKLMQLDGDLMNHEGSIAVHGRPKNQVVVIPRPETVRSDAPAPSEKEESDAD